MLLKREKQKHNDNGIRFAQLQFTTTPRSCAQPDGSVNFPSCGSDDGQIYAIRTTRGVTGYFQSFVLRNVQRPKTADSGHSVLLFYRE